MLTQKTLDFLILRDAAVPLSFHFAAALDSPFLRR